MWMTSNWLERNKILIRCGKYSTKKLIWEDQHHSLIMYTWSALKDNAKQAKILVDNYRTLFESRISAGATEKLPCCGDSRVWWKHYSGDDWGCFKLCFKVSRFIPAESTCVSCWSAQCELCESCPAHQVLVFPFLLACITAQEISRVHLIPHGSGACVL